MVDLSNLHYLAIDPGGKTTGWAAFDEEGNEISFDKITGGADVFMDWLEALDPPPKKIICEEYRIDPSVGHNFSTVPTLQLIGMIKRYAKSCGATVVMQLNTCLPIGLRQAGFYNVYYKDRKRIKHVDDAVSAYAHGVYYLIKNKIRKPRI